MTDNLRSRLNELETTVEGLTKEIVEIQQRLDEVEGKDKERDEVGVAIDGEDEEGDDIYVA